MVADEKPCVRWQGFLFIFLCIGLALFGGTSGRGDAPVDDERVVSGVAEPSVTRMQVFDAAEEVFWQGPTRPSAGLLLLAHGCSHTAYDWWDKTENCPLCLGLPEERTIVKTALERGYTVIAISSQDR